LDELKTIILNINPKFLIIVSEDMLSKFVRSDELSNDLGIIGFAFYKNSESICLAWRKLDEHHYYVENFDLKNLDLSLETYLHDSLKKFFGKRNIIKLKEVLEDG